MTDYISIIGSSGAIGSAFIKQLAEKNPNAKIGAFSRDGLGEFYDNVTYHKMDYQNEDSIRHAASLVSEQGRLSMVIVATGILHDDHLMPEKSLRDLSASNFQHLFDANVILPAIVAKHFLPLLSKDQKSIFAVLSARAGSISDNQMGGWYAYRASKAALNMIVKNAAIEVGRRNQQAIVVALHPGVVDSFLSQPFKSSIPQDQLFTPRFAVTQLLEVLDQLTPVQSGKFFAWDGEEISP